MTESSLRPTSTLALEDVKHGVGYPWNANVLLRSIFPGLHLAEASMSTTGAMSLAVFNIPKVVGNGIEINPASSGTITGSHLKPFKCPTKPRSATAVALIEQNVDY